LDGDGSAEERSDEPHAKSTTAPPHHGRSAPLIVEGWTIADEAFDGRSLAITPRWAHRNANVSRPPSSVTMPIAARNGSELVLQQRSEPDADHRPSSQFKGHDDEHGGLPLLVSRTW
jgi:hypothetical protein